jgi:hypothetical protein
MKHRALAAVVIAAVSVRIRIDSRPFAGDRGLLNLASTSRSIQVSNSLLALRPTTP